MNPLQSRRDRLREEIDREEQQLRAAVGQLKDSLRKTVSVGERASQKPYVALVLATAVGFVLGALPVQGADLP